MPRDIYDFITLLESEGELIRLQEPASPELEIAELTGRVSSRRGPALLFENVLGSEIPVLTNSFGSLRRTEVSSCASSYEEAGQRLTKILSGKEHEYAPVSAETAKFCELNFDNRSASIYRLPNLKFMPGDAGSALTYACIITKDPETDVQNSGIYRLQIIGERRLILHAYESSGSMKHLQKARSTGMKSLPAAVVISPEPSFIFASAFPAPSHIDEFDIAGACTGRPLQYFQLEDSGLKVPSSAHIVIQGEISTTKTAPEGPFANHTGFYSQTGEFPVLEITKMQMRRDAVYTASVPGKPPAENCYLWMGAVKALMPYLRSKIQGLSDIALPVEGVFGNLMFISINSTRPSQAASVVRELAALQILPTSKTVVVVDDDIDVNDTSSVLWRLGNTVSWEKDIFIDENGFSTMKLSANFADSFKTAVIDATVKTLKSAPQRPAEMDGKIKRIVDEKWGGSGLR